MVQRKNNSPKKMGSSEGSKLSTTQSDIMKSAGDPRASDTSDSDSAPEDVAFAASKQGTLQALQKFKESVAAQKDVKKKNRQKREELFREQKKQRLEALKSAAVPGDVQEAVSGSFPQTRAPPQTPAAPGPDPTAPTLLRAKKFEEPSAETQDYLADFIPLDTDGRERVAAVDEAKPFFSLPGVAATFRRDMLYSDHLPRQSAEARRSVAAKRKARRKT